MSAPVGDRYVESYVARLFAGRKGHGQRDGVVYRVLRPSALRTILREVYQRGFDDGRGPERRIELK